MIPALPKTQLLAQCRKMLLIRHFEEALIGLHREGRFRGHYHVYIGQEATGVPAISLLEPDDLLFSTHRNHGHILARGGDPGRLLAEILGRRDGYNRGKGGSFHTSPRELGFLQCSGVVGGILPLGTGAAYAAKSRASGQIAVCLFGDGALEEGAVPEAFNLALAVEAAGALPVREQRQVRRRQRRRGDAVLHHGGVPLSRTFPRPTRYPPCRWTAPMPPRSTRR